MPPATFNTTCRTVTDVAGNIYVADAANHKIRRITPEGAVETYAGTGVQGSADGNRDVATFSVPFGIAIGPGGDLFVSEAAGNKIRRISPQGVVSTFAGSGTYGSADGSGAIARFSNPLGIAADAAGNLYVADTDTHKIRKISPQGVVSTHAGTGQSGNINGPAATARFSAPYDVAVDPVGNVYVADCDSHSIRKILPSGEVTTLAGSGSPGFTDGAGAGARFHSPFGVTLDPAGNVYVADANNGKIRKVSPSGNVTTLPVTESLVVPLDVSWDPAGFLNVTCWGWHRVYVFTPEGQVVLTVGSGSAGAQDSTGLPPGLIQPTGVVAMGGEVLAVADSSGRLRNVTSGTIHTRAVASLTGVALGPDNHFYGTSESGHRVYKINLDGDVVVFAGSGSAGSADGAGTEASFTQPSGIAVDQSGNVYVADSGNNRIRKITPAGVVSTFAVSSGPGGTFSFPRGVAVDATGNVLVADTNNSRIRKVTPAGVISNYAGAGAGYQDGTLATAKFWQPSGIAFDASGVMYVADRGNYRIRKILTNGMVETLAGSGARGSANGYGTAASFGSPVALSVSPEGDIFVADAANHQIRKITPGGYTSLFSGRATCLDGPAKDARFFGPSGAAVDSGGNVYVADTSNSRIRRIDPQGNVTTFAGNETSGAADGTGASASFHLPAGVTVDEDDNVYVADTQNHRIRKITPAGVVSTFAGTGQTGSTDGVAATFYAPTGVAADGEGNVYVADQGSQKIRKIDTNGVVTTLAGSGQSGFLNGSGAGANFNYPNDLTVGSDGNIYVADTSNFRVRKITPAGVVTTFAGSGQAGDADGLGEEATFRSVYAISADGSGNLYVIDSNRVRKIEPSGMVTTLAGSSASGKVNGPGSGARFNGPRGIAASSGGTIYIADTNNCLIRKIQLPPKPQTITFHPLAQRTYGDAPFDLSASTSSGLPVGFSVVSGPAVIAGGKLKMNGAGTVTVRASQAGNGEYAVADPVERSFEVAKAGQSILFDTLTDAGVSSPPFGIAATASSGLPVEFSVISGPASVSGNTVTLAGTIGVVVIRAIQAGDANYLGAAMVERSFEVGSPLFGFLAESGIPADQRGASDDPDEDGVDNLLEYAFGMDPAAADGGHLEAGGSSGLPRVEVTEEGEQPLLTVEFVRKRNSGLTYIPEYSATLDGFEPLGGTETVTPINAEWERVTVIEPEPVEPPKRAFVRVRVVSP